MNIEEIIEFENETTSLDFKTVQYVRGNYDSFLKDMISMANGKTHGRKLIIIGIKHHTNGTREFLGIKDSLVDDSTYQQLINENIEPEIKFSYSPLIYKNTQLGIFELFSCSDKPYMMKKDFKNLRKGDGFIRKGSHQTRLTRKDIDDFVKIKITEKTFSGHVDINFLGNGKKELELKAISELQPPSTEAKRKIERILKERDSQLKNQKGLPSSWNNQDLKMFWGTPYEKRSTTNLIEDLKKVNKTFEEHDLNYLFEEKAYRINFTLINNGEEYIEDASVKVVIERNDSVLVADKIYKKPNPSNLFNGLSQIDAEHSLLSLRYPTVNTAATEYAIFEDLGNLKHLIETEVFEVPIRVLVNTKGIGRSVLVRVFVYGKNLQKPILEELIINIKG